MTDEYFSIGSRVSIKTSQGKDVIGEVLAFDPISKMLILKNKASCGRPSFCDVRLVNLHQARDVKVLEESSTEPPSPSSLNTDRLKKRVQAETEKKKFFVQALSAGVSPDGQGVFSALRKTKGSVIKIRNAASMSKLEVSEQRNLGRVNIIVQKEVKIVPPYTSSSVVGNPDSKAYIHVKKIIEKHFKDIGTGAT
nr:EOG090X0FOW [Artemia franciscana]